MKYFVFSLIIMVGFFSKAQLNCEDVKSTSKSFTLTACRNGKGKLFNTDTAITNRFQYPFFEIRQLKNMPEKIQEDIKRYKFPLKQDDSLIVYDWDMMHQAKMGYFGPAIAKIRIDCSDSTVYLYKYLLNKETQNYVPTRFKMFKIGKENFILSDKDHPYLNINYYFKLTEN